MGGGGGTGTGSPFWDPKQGSDPQLVFPIFQEKGSSPNT